MLSTLQHARNREVVGLAMFRHVLLRVLHALLSLHTGRILPNPHKDFSAVVNNEHIIRVQTIAVKRPWRGSAELHINKWFDASIQ